MVIQHRGTSPKLGTSLGWCPYIPMYSSLFLRCWWCNILGNDFLEDAVLLLKLIDLVYEIHYFLTELAGDGQSTINLGMQLG